MAKKPVRPVIDLVSFCEGKETIYAAFGKVYAQIFRDKLTAAPLQVKPEGDRLKSS